MGAPVTKHYWEHNGRKYFRGNAENVEVGSFGQKKDPIGPDAYLAVQNRVKSDCLGNRVRYLGSVGVDWAKVTQADLEANGSVKLFGLQGERAVNASYAEVKNSKFQLAGFAIDEGPLKAMLNTDADGARAFLAAEGGDGRIASEVWVVMEAQLSEHFATSAAYAVSASVAGVGLDVVAKGGSQGTEKITLSRGSTFAYMLHKVKKWNKHKTKVEDLEDDYKGWQ
jgi:hypothetical protein